MIYSHLYFLLIITSTCVVPVPVPSVRTLITAQGFPDFYDYAGNRLPSVQISSDNSGVSAYFWVSAYRQVCYYTNWSQYRTGQGKFLPGDIDPNLCTHIVYSFASLTGSDLTPAEWNDVSTPWMKGMYEKVVDLKAQNSKLKVLLAVGGWTAGSKPFSKIAQVDASRRQFTASTIGFLRNNSFDGLDVDWEYPAARGGSAADKTNFAELLKVLRQEFDNEATSSGKDRLILSIAIPAGKTKIDGGYDIPSMIRYADMFNLMAYDLHGGWDTSTGHNSGLFQHSKDTGSNAQLNVDWTANYWVKGGIPPSMLNIGLALYGRGFTLQHTYSHDIGASASGPSDSGKITREKGFLAYYEICELLKNGGTRYYLQDQMVPYVVNGSQWIGYEDEDSIRTKVRYIKQHNFGGTMVWAIDLDDFSGLCGQGKFPLMHAIDDELKKSGGQPVTPLFQPSTTTTLSSTTATTTQTTTQHVSSSTTSGPSVNSASTQTTGSSSGFSCASKRDGFYSNPVSCGSYYICASHSPFLVHCASGLEYNAKTRFCDWPQNAGCSKQAPNNNNSPSTTANANQPTQVLQFTPAGQTQNPSGTTQPIKVLQFTPVGQTQNPSATNQPTKLLQFTQNPSATNQPTKVLQFTQNPLGTNQPTKILQFTPAGQTLTPSATNQPTQVLVFTPSATNGPANTQSPVATQGPTKLLIFGPGFTNKPTNSPKTTTTNSQITGSTPAFNANFCKTQTDGLHRDPTNCGYYYSCSFGYTYHEPCPPGTAFNEPLEACDYAGNVPGCPIG